ncbi:crosslink repair DNA glycosylase YcaQ family protein [Kitasatospora sp. NPDC096128]|uniref:winged helix-turn-helix domain-containing protein n=1 Tax=Kitasatospora sp. NPDC096128 TaxID=3155547 RepID=UPI0033196F42
MPTTPSVSSTTARRLAISAQFLAGPPAPPTVDGIREVLRALRCLQLDPISAVAQSHLLVLWSRLGQYRREDLDHLLWEARWLFEYWAHAASIVLTDDYPLHAATMRRYPAGTSNYGRKVATWLKANGTLQTHVVQRLTEAGPLPAGGFDDVAETPWESSGWTAGRNVERMLDHLWLQGRIMVSGRRGRARLWDLAPRCLPGDAASAPLPDAEVVPLAAEHALRALGIARPADIRQHFTRDRYPGLDSALTRLLAEGRILRVQLEDAPSSEGWYLTADRLPLLERLESGEWEPRTTLLSPFDNLICDRARTERLWDFGFRNEMYVPRAKRRYGYYVMPLLHGDRLVGRVAPRLDRRSRTLHLEGLFVEPDTPTDDALRAGLADTVAALAEFVDARATVRTGPCPPDWADLFPEG